MSGRLFSLSSSERPEGKMAGPNVHRCSKVVMPASLFFTNVAVLLFGLTVISVGLWAFLQERGYFSISDGDPELTRLPISMILVGIFVSLLSLLGMFGALLIRTIGGRIFVGTYAFVLALVIISEVGNGVTAVRLKGRIESVFVNSSDNYLKRYDEDRAVKERWDHFQISHHCCGSSGYASYFDMLNGTVPASCCRADLSVEECDTARLNATAPDASSELYTRGCPAVVLGYLRQQLDALAAVSLVFGTAQSVAIVVAAITLILSTREEKTSSHGYARLRHTNAS